MDIVVLFDIHKPPVCVPHHFVCKKRPHQLTFVARVGLVVVTFLSLSPSKPHPVPNEPTVVARCVEVVVVVFDALRRWRCHCHCSSNRLTIK